MTIFHDNNSKLSLNCDCRKGGLLQIYEQSVDSEDCNRAINSLGDVTLIRGHSWSAPGEINGSETKKLTFQKILLIYTHSSRTIPSL